MIEKNDIEKALKIGVVNSLKKAIADSGRIANEVNDVLSRRRDNSCKFPVKMTLSIAVDDNAKTVGVECSVSAERENIKLTSEPSVFPMDDPNQPEFNLVFDNTEGKDGPEEITE